MDAIKLLKALNRMCKTFDDCEDCPICKAYEGCPFNLAPYRHNPAQYSGLIAVVETWLKENPPKTRGQVFLERNPDSAKSILGLPLVRPCDYLGDEITLEQCEAYDNCSECIEKFWEETADEEG